MKVTNVVLLTPKLLKVLKVLEIFKVLRTKQVLDVIIKFIQNKIIALQMDTNLDNEEIKNSLNEEQSVNGTEKSSGASIQEEDTSISEPEMGESTDLVKTEYSNILYFYFL